MNLDDISVEKGCGISKKAAHCLRQSLLTFLSPLLIELDELIDKRLVRTFFKTVLRLSNFAMLQMDFC
jgi:hypothetical protein